MNAPEVTPVKTGDDVDLYCEVIGEGDPSVVVPMACILQPELKHLRNRNRFVFYDLRNRGRSSETDRVGQEADVEDLNTVAEALNLPRMILIGWSYLGRVVSAYAGLHPQRVAGLLLVCPAPATEYEQTWLARRRELENERDDPGLRKELDLMETDGRAEADPANFAREYWRYRFGLQMKTRESFNRLKGQPWIYPNESPQHVMTNFMRMKPPSWDKELSTLASKVECPVLVIAGEEDLIPLEACEQWVDLFPHADLEVIPKAGHYPFAENPGQFFAAIQDFLL